MEDHQRPELPGEDDPLDLFDSEGESAFAERDFEPLTASPVYGTTPPNGAQVADTPRAPAPHALHPSLAQGRAGAPASPWMVITGAAAVVIVLLAVPLLLSGGSNDPSDLSSPSVEPDRSPASPVSRVPEPLPPTPVDNSRSEDSSSADARDTSRVSDEDRERAIQAAAREASTPAAREATPAVDQRSRDADTVATSRVPSVTPTPVRPEPAPPSTSAAPPATSVSSGATALPPDTSSTPANTPPVTSASTPSPTASAPSTLPSGPAPAAVTERAVLSSEVARTPPPTAAAATAVVPPQTLIRNVLNRYRDALNALDPMAARAVWPSADVKGLDKAFKGLKEQRLQFDNCTINPVGATATASCVGKVAYVPKVGGKGDVKDQQWEFKLLEKNDSWLIDRVVTTR